MHTHVNTSCAICKPKLYFHRSVGHYFTANYSDKSIYINKMQVEDILKPNQVQEHRHCSKMPSTVPIILLSL